MNEVNPKQKIEDLIRKMREYNVNDLTARILLDNAGIMIMTLMNEIEFQTKKADEFKRAYNNAMKELLK